MPRESELYRLELAQAREIFGEDNFLSIHQLAKRTGVSQDKMRALFVGEVIPPVGVSIARYAHALARPRGPKDGRYINARR